MNQKQRDFLIDKIRDQVRISKEKLKERRPTPPSLNNYLAAAALSGKLTTKSPESISAYVTKRVLALGPKDSIVEPQYRYGIVDKDEGNYVVAIPVEELFDLPHNYRDAYDEYAKDLAIWKREWDEIEQVGKTLEIKVTLGSDKALSALIEQADNLGDVRIINAHLTAIEYKP